MEVCGSGDICEAIRCLLFTASFDSSVFVAALEVCYFLRLGDGDLEFDCFSVFVLRIFSSLSPSRSLCSGFVPWKMFMKLFQTTFYIWMKVLFSL